MAIYSTFQPTANLYFRSGEHAVLSSCPKDVPGKIISNRPPHPLINSLRIYIFLRKRIKRVRKDPANPATRSDERAFGLCEKSGLHVCSSRRAILNSTAQRFQGVKFYSLKVYGLRSRVVGSIPDDDDDDERRRMHELFVAGRDYFRLSTATLAGRNLVGPRPAGMKPPVMRIERLL